MFLDGIFGSKLTKPRESDGSRRRFYQFPPLKECRKIFASKTQGRIIWDDPDVKWEKE